MRLILYNIEYLEGMKGKKLEYGKFWRRFLHPDGIEIGIAKSLKKLNPDIVAFIEASRRSLVGHKDNFDYFKKEFGMKYGIEKLKYKFDGLIGFLNTVPVLKDQSNALLSKYRLSDVEYLYLKEGMKKLVIKATICVPKKINLLVAHLALGDETRRAQISELAEIVKKLKGPVILMGDFNTFGGEKEIKKLLKETNLKHEFKLGKRKMTYPTYNPRRRFDYILTSPEIKVKDYKVLKLGFSDHLPVMVDFNIRGKRK